MNHVTRELPRLRCFTPALRPERQGRLIGDFSTTVRCNARCIGCYTNAGRLARTERDRLGRSFLDADQWSRLLDELDPYIRAIVFSGLGDATFDRWEMNQCLMDQAIARGIDVCMFTNGILMDESMADWIAERENISVIGKWLHSDPEQHERLLGVGKGSSGEYVWRSGAQVPRHIALLMDREMHTNSRLAVANTILQSNREVAPVMWRWLREQEVIPIFSWLVPTPGMGMQAKTELGEDLSWEERENVTQSCWQIDQSLGYQWEFCLGPRITVNRCGDEHLIYFGPFGDVRLCPSSHKDPLVYWPDKSVDEVIEFKRGLESNIKDVRSSIDNRPSCLCTATCDSARESDAELSTLPIVQLRTDS